MHSEIADEKLLVVQFSQGNHIAFKTLFVRYYPKVRSFIMGLVKSESETEDLAQEVFLKLWTHRERFREVEVFGTYLYVLTKNTTFNYLRSRQNRQDDQRADSVEESTDTTPYEELVAKDLQLLIDMVVENMPPQRQTIFRLNREAGFTNAEIAEKLQISKKTVENHLNLALKELKNALLLFIFLYLC
ncbi:MULTISPECIES: RNA polymerase sigma-70 factor [Bacteroides]|uniref:RNA polymerase sigma-70 factor n=1 Tax=Bacteroides TaxID=816 RepID=UPI0002808607|nr:RNA polymerase sigma-70 factor [Bacteroides fragilis]EKA89237.1 RNA polymerase sigma-70 factor, expansion family 1 [Bacteroides fragilis HMW 610]